MSTGTIKKFSLRRNQSIYSSTPPEIRKVFTNIENCHVDVEFTEGLSTEEVIAHINQLPNPQVVVWYMGCYGLREAGVQFYKDFLISPTLNQHADATFWLVDLTAWGAFKSIQRSIHEDNSCSKKIERFPNPQIKCITSSKIFKKIQEISDKKIVEYLRKALNRKFISENSKNYPDKKISLKSILSENCPVLLPWHNYDVSKAYSVVQYLEGCLLVDEILSQKVTKKELNNIQIVFALPNDELKYYKDEENSFQKDITFLISKRCEELNIKHLHLQIKFLAFQYGSHLNERPYNAPGKAIKNGNLSYYDVVDYSLNNEEKSQEELIYEPCFS